MFCCGGCSFFFFVCFRTSPIMCNVFITYISPFNLLWYALLEPTVFQIQPPYFHKVGVRSACTLPSPKPTGMLFCFWQVCHFEITDCCFSLSLSLQAIRKCHRAINESRAQKRKVICFVLMVFILPCSLCHQPSMSLYGNLLPS